MQENSGQGGRKSRLYSPKQVGEWLGISRRHVLRLGIAQIRVGRKTIRYREEDIYAFILMIIVLMVRPAGLLGVISKVKA